MTDLQINNKYNPLLLGKYQMDAIRVLVKAANMKCVCNGIRVVSCIACDSQEILYEIELR